MSNPKEERTADKNRAPSDAERRLVEELKASLDDPKRSKALISRLYREIIMSPDGVTRLVNEAVFGDGFRDALDRAFGKAPQTVEVEGGPGFSFALPADTSPELLYALAALASLQAERDRVQLAKVESESDGHTETRAERLITTGSDKKDYVNSDTLKPRTLTRIF